MKSLNLTILPATFAAMMVSGIALAGPAEEPQTSFTLAQNEETSRESGPESDEDMKQDEDPATDTMSNTPETDQNEAGGDPEGTSTEGSEDIDGDDSDNDAAMDGTGSVADEDLVEEDKDENITE